MPLLILAVTFALLWVLFILPQQRRVKAHQAVVAALGVGDEVMTSAGLFGTVTGLDDEHVRMEVAPGVVLRFARGAVARSVTAELAAGSDTEAVARPRGTAADRALDGGSTSPAPQPDVAAESGGDADRP